MRGCRASANIDAVANVPPEGASVADGENIFMPFASSSAALSETHESRPGDRSARKTWAYNSPNRETIVPIENSSAALRRAASPMLDRRECDMRSKELHASASAAGSPEGTTMPVSPTIDRESPTSVTTQGTPQAIASTMMLPNPSP